MNWITIDIHWIYSIVKGVGECYIIRYWPPSAVSMRVSEFHFIPKQRKFSSNAKLWIGIFYAKISIHIQEYPLSKAYYYTLLHPVSTPQILMELKTLLKRGLIMHFSTLQHYNLPLEDFLMNTTFCVTFFIRILRSFLTLPSF